MDKINIHHEYITNRKSLNDSAFSNFDFAFDGILDYKSLYSSYKLETLASEIKKQKTKKYSKKYSNDNDISIFLT